MVQLYELNAFLIFSFASYLFLFSTMFRNWTILILILLPSVEIAFRSSLLMALFESNINNIFFWSFSLKLIEFIWIWIILELRKEIFFQNV